MLGVAARHRRFLFTDIEGSTTLWGVIATLWHRRR